MRLIDIKNKLEYPKVNTTLCFLIRDDEVLLAMNKVGPRRGKWSGLGRLMQPEESVIESAAKGVRNLINVSPLGLTKAAEIKLYFDSDDLTNKVVHVYLANKWDGKPIETSEYRPDWFLKDRLPYQLMKPDDIHWLPRVLSGQTVKGEFLYKDSENLIDKIVHQISF